MIGLGIGERGLGFPGLRLQVLNLGPSGPL